MPIKEKPINTTKGQLFDRILESVLNKFGFDSSWSLLPIIPMNGSPMVLNVHFETAHKAVIDYRGEQFILKQVPWYCSNIEFVNFMLSFHQYLYKKGFPIPQLMGPNNNLFAEFEGRFYYLQRFIIGEAYTGHPEEVANAGRHLGHMHILSERLFQETSAYQDERFRENPFQLARSMMNVLKQVQNLDKPENKSPETLLLKNFCREAQTFVDKIETHVGKQFHQSIFQVHGDYNPFNLLFGKQRDVIATFDLENTAVDNPCHDIAEAVLDFCFNRYRPNSTNFASLPEFFDKEKSITFLTAYNDVNPCIYEKVKAFLPCVGGAIFIELYTLGLVREDLEIETIPSALQIKEKIVRKFKEVIQ